MAIPSLSSVLVNALKRLGSLEDKAILGDDLLFYIVYL